MKQSSGHKTRRIGGNRKRFEQLTNAGLKSLETVFSIVICRQSGDKWQSKTLLVKIFDLRPSIVLTFPIAAYPVCKHKSEILPCDVLICTLCHTKFIVSNAMDTIQGIYAHLYLQ